jgi:carboxyl-terminal processing protease
MEIRLKTIYAVLLIIALALPVPAAWAEPETPEITAESDVVPAILESDQRHRQISRMVSRFVERAHYSRVSIDDALSSSVLDNYIEALDANKHYFLDSDIIYFARYRQEMDDVLRSGDLEPVFDIFRLYRLRAQQNT